LDIDRAHGTALLRGQPLRLTSREYAMLTCLVEAAGEIVSRNDLLARVWQREEDASSNLVEVHLSRLRDKLGDDASIIETVRRAGYRLRA
jgi:DNA-binding response OmpR family regulator